MTRVSRPTRGFTLIELMIVVAVISIVATIAIPNFVAARVRANETSAVANMKTLWTGQVQFQSGVKVDLDRDGIGEYGFLREMAGVVGTRTTADGSTVGPMLVPSPISIGFGDVDANGGAERTGYRYAILLPDATGVAVHETPSGAFSGDVGTDLSEVTFCVYAWPNKYPISGTRTFFVDLSGDVLATEWDQYSGDTFHAATVDGAAFVLGGGPLDSITGEPALGTYGRDLNWWSPVR